MWKYHLGINIDPAILEVPKLFKQTKTYLTVEEFLVRETSFTHTVKSSDMLKPKYYFWLKKKIK